MSGAAASEMAAHPWVVCDGSALRPPRAAPPPTPEAELRVLRVADLLAEPTVPRLAAETRTPREEVRATVDHLIAAGLMREITGGRFALTEAGEDVLLAETR